jgi:DNA-binding MarR family transcriptional regulator
MTNEPRWLSAEEQMSWRALIVGTTLLFDRLDQDLRREFGFSLVEYEILVRLSESGGELRMAALAASLAHSRSRVTHTVSRMEAMHLVARSPSAEDGRGTVCALTETGWATLKRAAPVHVQGVREHLVDQAAPEDFAALGRVLNAVADHLVPEHPERDIRPGSGISRG